MESISLVQKDEVAADSVWMDTRTQGEAFVIKAHGNIKVLTHFSLWEAMLT